MATTEAQSPRNHRRAVDNETTRILDALGYPSRLALAAALDVTRNNLDTWIYRNSIPGRYHLKILELAEERGAEITRAQLMDLVA